MTRPMLPFEPGMVLPTREFRVERSDLTRYAQASGDRNPIHLSADAAQTAGHSDVVTHGMLLMGLAMRVVTRWANDPTRVLNSSARFLRPVPISQETGAWVTVKGAVSQVDSKGCATVEMTVRCEVSTVATVTVAVAGPRDRSHAHDAIDR